MWDYTLETGVGALLSVFFTDLGVVFGVSALAARGVRLAVDVGVLFLEAGVVFLTVVFLAAAATELDDPFGVFSGDFPFEVPKQDSNVAIKIQMGFKEHRTLCLSR